MVTVLLPRQLKELSPVLHFANLVASEMIHFVHQLAYYITFEVIDTNVHLGCTMHAR